jgi:hypothetical protein
MDCSLLFNKVKREGDNQRCTVELSCRPRNHAGKISPQLAGIAASIIKSIRVDVLECACRFRAFRNRMEQQMGLFHCVAEDD